MHKRKNTLTKQTKENQVSLDPLDPQFISPLKSFKDTFCMKCSDYGQECNDKTTAGVDRMFLCITAMSALEPTPSFAKIMQDASAVIEGLTGQEPEK